MYLMKRDAQERPPRTPAVLPALIESVQLTGMSQAIIAVSSETRGRAGVVVRMRYARPSAAGQQAEPARLTAAMRQALVSALDSGCPILTTSQRATRGGRPPRVFIAVPIMEGGRARAVLGALGTIPAPYSGAVRALRQIAGALNTQTLFAAPGAPNAFLRAASARQDVLLHELRVPLSAASLLLERLARLRAWEPISEDASDQARAALAAVREAQSIVRALSQLQALSQDTLPIAPRPLQVQEIIERAVTLLPGSVGRLRRLAPEGLPAVIADPLWLTHILTNLLENAMTYTPSPQLADVTAGLAADGQRVIISITSYGAGIPVAEQERILQPYQRQAPADDLTSKGLGLSIAKYLVTAMRGELWLESDGQHSATFHVALPLAASEGARSRPQRAMRRARRN